MSTKQNKVNIYRSKEKDFHPTKIRRFFKTRSGDFSTARRIFFLPRDFQDQIRRFFNHQNYFSPTKNFSILDREVSQQPEGFSSYQGLCFSLQQGVFQSKEFSSCQRSFSNNKMFTRFQEVLYLPRCREGSTTYKT